jgi:alpha-tubulin suppressor-like RCC1 family protein
MAKNQVIYNVEDIFIGPCPASGNHFINYSGGLNNNYEDLPDVTYENFRHISPNLAVINAIISKDKNENTFARNHNLLKRLDRIQNISYDISTNRTIINQIGKAASVDRIHLNKPQVSVSFSYILSSLRNEARMGFNINHPRLDYPYTGDKYHYRTDNGDPLFLFSGFLNRDYSKNYPQLSSRGEGIGVGSPCFEYIEPSSPYPDIVSQKIPFYVGKNINPIIKINEGADDAGDLSLIADVAAGFYHSFLIRNDGTVFGWGDNTEGQLTNNLNSNDANGEFTGNWNNTIIGKFTGIKKISTNYLHTLAILSDDKITGWGANDEGQAVGTTGFNDSNYLFTGNWSNTPVGRLSGISEISAGAYHSLAIRNINGGTVTGWGDNISGQASRGNNLTGIIGISAGGYHSLAIRNISGGLVTGWGDNDYLQSSRGNNLTGVRMVSAGHLHSFALLNNGRVTGWGWNDDGQVAGIRNLNNISGIFTGNWNNTPVGQLIGVKSIHAGWFHTLALLQNNKITGWGFNNVGQISENISYNDSNGIFTGNWDSTIVGSFENVKNIDTSYQTSLAFIEPSINSDKNVITGWGEDDIVYVNTKYNEYDCITTDPYWPLTTKDKRNIFISISEDQQNQNLNLYENFTNLDDQSFIARSADKKSQTNRTIGFGNCYLAAYNQSASVGNFITAEVNYIGENMLFQMSGSGANIPHVNPKTYETNTGIKFNIPSELDSKNPIAALQPGDINMNINSSGYGLDLNDVKIQGYQFGFEFNRENMDAIGYKLPIDREINLPLIINLSVDMIVGDQQYDDLTSLIREDADYNVSISCKNSCVYDPNFTWTGQNQSSEFEKRFENAFNYQFFNCKFDGISYANQIGARKTAKLNFTTEVDTENYNRGMQASGILGIEKVEDFILIQNSGNYINISGAGSNDVNGDYIKTSEGLVWNKIGGINFPKANYSALRKDSASNWSIYYTGAVYYTASSSSSNPLNLNWVNNPTFAILPKPTLSLIYEDGNYLLQEDDDLLVSNLQLLY